MIDSLFFIDGTTQSAIDSVMAVGLFTIAKTTLIDMFNNNQFLSGGILLGVLASLGYYLKTIPQWIWGRITRLLSFTLYFDENDKFFTYFNRWLKANHSSKVRNAQITISEKNNRNGEEDCIVKTSSGVEDDIKNEKNKSKYYINPKNDYFLVWFKGCPIRIDKNQEKLEQAKDFSSLMYNNYTLSGFFAKKKIFQLIDDIMEYSDKEKEKSQNTDVYMKRYESWNYVASKNGRSIQSVVMDNDTKNKIVQDITTFIKSELWYFKRGIPYRRSYMFHGCPGSGKSSLVRALASLIKSNIHYLNLSDETTSDTDLMYLVSKLEGKFPILVIEDIDTVFEGRTNITKSMISFSGLLNCLDGLFAKSGMITIFTTNHIEKLDPALIRTGRVDVKIEMNFPTSDMIKEYFNLFFDKQFTNESINIKNVTMSDIQEVCIINKDDYKQAEKDIIALLKVNKIETIKTKIVKENKYATTTKSM